jgi:phosphopantetheinyl transferase (holo-ACP synthase)
VTWASLPYAFSGKAKGVFEKKGGMHIHISLSHIKMQAVAFVVISEEAEDPLA